MAVVTPQRPGASEPDTGDPADALVIFGITGDLAKVMTFRSLYRLEAVGRLTCPIVGVAGNDWTLEQLRTHARECIEGTGETVDDGVFQRFATRLSYVHGDFADAGTYKRVSEAIGGAHRPVFYLEIPPFLFATVITALTEAGLTANARVVVEKPCGHDLQSARELMQLLAAAAMEAPAGADAATLKDAKYAVFRSMPEADPAHYGRGQYDGYLKIDGVADDSTTETYAAMRLEIDNWRWAGVPWFIRTGKRLPVTQTEVRLIFKRPPRLGFLEGSGRPPVESQLVIKLDPITGVRLVVDAPFTRQDSVEETWRILRPLIEQPPPVHRYAPDSWGPPEADGLLSGFGRWHGPWVVS